MTYGTIDDLHNIFYVRTYVHINLKFNPKMEEGFKINIPYSIMYKIKFILIIRYCIFNNNSVILRLATEMLQLKRKDWLQK